MTFEDLNLNKPLLNAISDLGYIEPTPIQAQAFAPIMSGKDLVGIAQTGTGKTFAYLLPLLRQLSFSKQKNPRVLIIVPTRELVIQVHKSIEDLTKYMSIRTVAVYGGTNIKTQRKLVFEGLDVLVATPGRLMDLAMSRELKLKDVRKLVIDEVDEMLNLGFRTQLMNVFDMLPERRQNLLFSATLTPEVGELIEDFFNLPQKIEVAPHGTPLEQIEQSAYHVPNYNTKRNLLESLLKDEEAFSKVLVFVSNKKIADRLHEQLLAIFPEIIGVIHSNKSQNYRIRSVNNFGDGTFRVLIATDIIARGLDISEVSHVINFDLPDEPANYIHRIGRTGRADKRGNAISFINNQEEEYQMAIEKLMKQVIPITPLPEDLAISEELMPEEMPEVLGDKNYLYEHTLKNSQGAFHEKSQKNSKVNLGGSYKRRIKEKYKKPKTRSGKQKKKR